MSAFSRATTIRMLALLCLAAVVGVVASSPGRTDVADEAIQLHLKLYAAAIYEHHSRAGAWPTQIDDLAQTSLPVRSPYWRGMLADEVFVIVWPQGFDENPERNGNRVVAYHNKGTLARSGSIWVCWGDLRTEYIKDGELSAHRQRGA